MRNIKKEIEEIYKLSAGLNLYMVMCEEKKKERIFFELKIIKNKIEKILSENDK